MAVEEIMAYRISDGRCFAGKQAAYHEEIVLLLRKLPDAAKKGFNLAALDKAIVDVAGLLGQVDALREQLFDEVDRPIGVRLNKMVEDLRRWHKRAVDLRGQITGETDPEIRQGVERQE